MGAKPSVPEEKLNTVKDACLIAVESWKDTPKEKVDVEALAGGMSGAGVFKVTVTGSVPEVVICKTLRVDPNAKEHKVQIAEAAVSAFGKDPKDVNFCGITYLSGDPAFPGIQVIEFAGGGTVGQGHLWDNDSDATAHAKCLGLLHAHDQGWWNEQGYTLKDTGLLMDPNKIGCKAWDEILVKYPDSGYGDLKHYFMMPAACGEESIQEVVSSGSAGLWLLQRLSVVPTNAQFLAAAEWLKGMPAWVDHILDLNDEEPSLMDRLVLCHGDAHGGQFIHRVKDQSGHLMMIDFDQAMRTPAWYDFGSSAYTYFMGAYVNQDQNAEKPTWPSVETLKKASKAYRDAIESKESLDKYKKNTVEDIMYDINKGFVGRLIFIGLIMTLWMGLTQKKTNYLTFLHFFIAEQASNLLKNARTDAKLKTDIRDRGIADLTAEAICSKLEAQDFAQAMEMWKKDPRGVAGKLCSLPLGPVDQESPLGSKRGGCTCSGCTLQ